jgi:DNA-binding NarL/FixJ family response regulator
VLAIWGYLFFMSKDIIRILVVDDYEIVRKSIMALLAKEPDMEVVGTAVNGRDAIQLAQTTKPDVIVMDISMPELDGIRTAGEIQELGISTQIIMLSMHYNSTLMQQARKNGASGYIVKQQATSDLIPAIRAAYEGALSL